MVRVEPRNPVTGLLAVPKIAIEMLKRLLLEDAWIEWIFFVVFASGAFHLLIRGETDLGSTLEQAYGISAKDSRIAVTLLSLTCALIAIAWLSAENHRKVTSFTLVFLTLGSFHIGFLLLSGAAQGCGCGYKPTFMTPMSFNLLSLAKNFGLIAIAALALRRSSPLGQ